MSIEDKYPFNINLEDSWLAYDIQKFNEVRNDYQVALRELNNIEWEQLKRVIKHNGAIVMTASQPFTTTLIASNIGMFKYCWVWEK